MKNNIAFKLALSSIKKDKKSYIISFIMMLIAFLSAMIIPSSLDAYERIHLLLLKKDYGNWIVCYQDLNEVSRKFLEINGAVDKCIDLSYIGRLKNNNYIANYNEDFFDIASIELKEGRLPQNEGEIISLEKKGYQINDIVKLNYFTDSNIEKEYKVVGIINDYNQKWITPSPDYFTYNNLEYNNYTYITSDYSLEFFEGFNKNCIYNFSLIGEDLTYIKGNGRVYSAVKYGLNTISNKMNYTNLFIGILSIGLFMVIFRESVQREKTVFLLRCIGMSKRDMKKYIFYESLLLSFIALGISIVIGTLIHLITSLYCYSVYGIFLFFELMMTATKYSLTIMIIIICLIYLSILPLSIRMMDSLIHRKERKILKKYHKIRRMTILNVSRSLTSKKMGYICAIGLLIVLMTTSILSITDHVSILSKDQKPVSATYEYSSPHLNRDVKKSFEESIIDYKELKMSSLDFQRGVSYGPHTFVSLESIDDLEKRLLEGRLPLEDNECLLYNFDDYIIYEQVYDIGSQIDVYCHIYNEETESSEDKYLKSYEVVGIINMDDYCELDRRYIWEMSNIGLVIREDALPVVIDSKDSFDWENNVYISSSKDIYLDVYNQVTNTLVPTTNPYVHKIAQTYYGLTLDTPNEYKDAIYMIAVMSVISIVNLYYLFVISKSMVNAFSKDLKLIRCLGMTFKQAMYVYGVISLEITLYSLFYHYLIRFMNYSMFAIGIHIVLLIVYLVFLFYFAYRKMDKTVAFYPTEVERYY